MTATVAPDTHSIPAAPPQRPRSRLRVCADWLLAGTHPEPDDIRNELLHQRASKTKTLAVAIFASLLTAINQEIFDGRLRSRNNFRDHAAAAIKKMKARLPT